MTGSASLASIREYFPGLWQYRYTEANLHRLQHGKGTPVPNYVLASCKTTSTASSLGGEVVCSGGSRPLQLLNAFLEKDGVKTINQPQMEWNKCTDRTKRRYAQHTRDILVAVLKVVSPKNTGYIWSALQASQALNDKLGVEGILHPSQHMYLQAIAET